MPLVAFEDFYFHFFFLLLRFYSRTDFLCALHLFVMSLIQWNVKTCNIKSGKRMEWRKIQWIMKKNKIFRRFSSSSSFCLAPLTHITKRQHHHQPFSVKYLSCVKAELWKAFRVSICDNTRRHCVSWNSFFSILHFHFLSFLFFRFYVSFMLFF